MMGLEIFHMEVLGVSDTLKDGMEALSLLGVQLPLCISSILAVCELYPFIINQKSVSKGFSEF